MHNKEKALRSDLGHARGLGSSKDGTGHWWGMKITALALVPLSLWFMVSVIGLLGADVVGARAWLSAPLNAVAMLLFIGFSLHHSANGLQVVIEDYVSCPVSKTVMIIGNQLAHVVAAALALYSILMIAVKG